MAKKKEDPAKVEQRKQERVAFVQGHPLLQPEQARQQFYVQTRAQELGAAGKPVDRAQLRENFQTGNIQREGFYTPGDISRVAAQQQNNNTSDNTSNNTNTPTPTPDAPTGPVYSGGQPTTRTTPSNDYVAPERTTALGGKIPAAAQFRMDSAGASGFGKTGESRLVPDTLPNQFANRTDASGNTGMGITPPRPNVEGPNVRMRNAVDTNSDSYLERRANNDETTLSEYQSQFPAWYKPNAAQLESEKFYTRKSRMTPTEIAADRAQAVANRYGAGLMAAETIAGTAAAIAGAPIAGVVAAGAAGVGLYSKVTGEIRQSETGLTNEEINKTAFLQGATSLVVGGALAGAGVLASKAIPKIKPALTGIKNWADTPGEAQPFVGLVNKIKLLNKEPIALPVRPPFQSNPMFPGEQLALPRGDSYTSFVEPPAVKPITGADRLENAAAVVAKNKGEVVPPVISGQSLADSKPGANIAADMKADNVTELTPRQIAARAREAKKKAARLALTKTTPATPGRITLSQVEADIEATRLADVAAGINNPPDPTIDDFLKSSKPQSALSQEPIGAATSDPNIASPTAPNASGTVTVAEMQAQTPVKPKPKPKAKIEPLPGTEPAWITEMKTKAAADKAAGIVDDIPVKNPNRNKALIRPEGDPLPGMERTGNHFDKAEQNFLNKTGFFDTEIPAPKPRSVFEARTDVDQAFSRITPDELGRAQLENKPLKELMQPHLADIKAENKALFRDRVRDYENKRYPNIDDMSGRPIPTPDANKPIDAGLVEAKRVFEETGVAPKRGSEYLLDKKTGEIYKVRKQSGVPLTPEQKLANKAANTAKQNANRKIARALNSGKIDVETAKEVLSAKPGTVTLADAIKKGAAKEVGTTELGTFVGKDGSLYTAKTKLPDTVKGPLGATGRQTARARAEIAAPVYPRGLPDNAPLFSPPRTITPALEKAYTTELANQTRIFETTGKPTAKEDQVRSLIKNLFGPETLGRIDAEAGTGLRTTIKLPSAVTEPTIGAAVKPKFLPSGKIQGETLDEQIANWTKYSNSEAFKTLSITNPQKYTEVVNANSAINAATKARVDEALAKQSAFKLQQPSSAGKGISSADDPWLKTGNNLPTEFAGGPAKLELDPFTQTPKDPVLAAAREQGLPYGAEINPADPRKFVPKQPSPIPANASKEQQMAFDAANKQYFDELNGVGPEALGREQAAMNLENQTALREQAAAMPNSPLKRETIKELNTFNRINRPEENYPGFGTTSQKRTMGENEFVFGKGPGDDPFQYGRTSPYSSIIPVDRNIKPGDTFESFLKVKGNAGKTEADYAAAMSDYNTRLASLEEQTPRFTGKVEPFVGRFTPEQNQSLEAWSASRQVTKTTPRTTVSIDELTAGSTNKARVAMEEDAFKRAEAIAEQAKFKAAQEAERTDYFNTRTERGDFNQMREGFARQDANKAAIPKPPTREEVLKTGVIRRLKTRIAEKEAADAAAAQAAAKANAEEALPLNVDQYYRERWDQSNPWVVQARQGYQARIDQSGLTNFESRYTNTGRWVDRTPAARTEQSAVVPRSEVSNAAPVSPGVQLRQSAANRDEWLAANEKLKGTPDYIGNPYEQTAAVNAIRNENTGDVGTQLKEFDYDEIFKD